MLCNYDNIFVAWKYVSNRGVIWLDNNNNSHLNLNYITSNWKFLLQLKEICLTKPLLKVYHNVGCNIYVIIYCTTKFIFEECNSIGRIYKQHRILATKNIIYHTNQNLFVKSVIVIFYATSTKFTACGDRTRYQRIKSSTLYLTELTRHNVIIS